MTLALFEQQIDDIDIEFQGLRQLDAIRRRRPGGGFPNSQGHALSDGDDLRHWRLSVEHGNRLAVSDRSEVLAEAGFEFCYPNRFHFSDYD
jgi:hypothetical protein